MKNNTLRCITYVMVASLFCINTMIAQEEHENHIGHDHHESSGKRILIHNPTTEQLHSIAGLGLDLHCGAKNIGSNLRLDIYGEALEAINTLNISYEVIEEDLANFFATRGRENLPLAIQQLEELKSQSVGNYRTFSELEASIDNPIQYDECSEFNWVAQNFQLGSMGGCLTVDEALAELDRMKTLFPDLISTRASASTSGMQTNGNTTGNGTTSSGIPIDFDPQDIFFVRISDNPEVDEMNEPESLITGMIHAREASSLMNVIYYMWYILENYDQDPVIKNMIDNQELYFVPIINPDGLKWNEIIQDGDSGGGQRKNLRPGVNDSGSVSAANDLRGIDLNRNSDYYWGFDDFGSSSNTNSDTYRGDSPGSENEIMIMQEFVDAHEFKTAINHHAGLNSIVTTSYNGDASATSGREDEFQNLMQHVTRYNRYVHGSAPNTLTAANGDINDWMFGGPVVNYNPIGPLTSNPSIGSGQGIITFSPENGDDFWPDPTEFITVVQRAVRINLITSLAAGKFAKLYDVTETAITSTSGQLDFEVEYIGQTLSDLTLTVTPVSDNILSITPPSATALNGMDKLEQRLVSASYTLDPAITANEPIEYMITLSNDTHVIYEATFIKYYTPSIITTADGISNWTTTSWSQTTEGYNGSTNAITSTTTSYGNSEESFVTLTNPVNLSGVSAAVVSFNATWDIERNFDLAQFEVSTDGGTTWVGLCGRHTRPAATQATSFHVTKNSVEEDFQSLNGSYIYDGDQFVDVTDDGTDNPTPKWVLEEVYIDEVSNPGIIGNSSVQFRFKFASDTSNRADGYNVDFRGFRFDNFKITDVSVDTRECLDGVVDTFPYTESFENGTGIFFQTTGDDGDWSVNIGRTPTSQSSRTTGPNSAFHEQSYMYTEASTNGLGSNATTILQSRCIDFTSEYNSISFAFNYHRFGSNFGNGIGTLDVEITDDRGVTWTELVPQITGASVDAWQEVVVDISAFSGKIVQIRFTAVTGNGFRSDLAIDNIRITASKEDYIHRLVGGVPTWTPTDPSGVAGVNDDIFVLSGTPTLTAATTMNDLFISDIATLNVGANTITVTGDIENNGTLNASSAEIIAQGNIARSISGNAFEVAKLNLDTNNSSTLTLESPLTINELLTLTDGELRTNNNLTLSSSATQSAMIDQVAAGTVNGTMTIERFVPARRAFRFVSSPLTTTTTIRENWQENGVNDPGFGTHITGSTTGENGFDTTPSGNPSLFTYDNSAVTPALTPIGNTDVNTLTAGEAYLLFVRGDRTIDVTSNSAVPTDTRLRANGTIVTGTTTITGTDINHNAGSFNLIGNPYQATVDMNSIVSSATNVNTNQYYVWDATLGARGAYVTVILTGTGSTNGAGSDANNFLQPWQSAFVTTATTVGDNSTSLSFNETDKTVGEDTDIFLLEDNPIVDNAHIIGQLFRTEAYNAGEKLQDNFVLLFSDSFSNDITLSDAGKFFNIDENMAISNGDHTLSVERRAIPVIDEEIQLFNNAYRTDLYTLRIQQSGLGQSEVTAYLEDTYTNELHELFEGENLIEFTIDGSDELSSSSDRFKIVFREQTLSTNDENAFEFSIYPNPVKDSDLFITSSTLSGKEVNLQMHNILGQLIFNKTQTFTNDTTRITEVEKLNAGIYFITLQSEEGKVTKRVVIQ